MKCLKCEKELYIGDCNIVDAGYMEISFHYGSRHDQCLGSAKPKRPQYKEGDVIPKKSRLQGLLASDKIQSYICDECFEKHLDLFEGYSVDKRVVETKIV